MGDGPTQVRVGAALTAEGVALLLFLVATLLVAWWTGNNLLYLVSSTLVGLAVMGIWGGARRVEAIRVRRVLPAEVVARRPAAGLIEVRAKRAIFDAVIEDTAGEARVHVAEAPAGSALALHTRWRFGERGVHRLGRIVASSTWPFGLVQRWAVIEVPDEVVVWPEPMLGGKLAMPGDAGPVRRGATPWSADEIADLRPYRPGDPLRDVHGPTSARVGRPMVVVRRQAAREPTWIVVEPRRGEDFEREIRLAAGCLAEAWRSGRPVGLRVGQVVLPPRTGAAWRRRLLEALAVARPDPPGDPVPPEARGIGARGTGR